MPSTFLRSPAATWLLLVAATLISYVSSIEGGADRRTAGSAVLLIAFYKARVIGLRFMELRDTVLVLRLLFEAWLAIVCILLLVLFWQAP